jgi:hypothetical protein
VSIELKYATMQKIGLLLILGAFCITTLAQNLTGTWEGKMDAEQFLQVNILHSSKGICGYSYDSVIASKGDYCRAYFEGKYKRRTNDFHMFGTKFLENSGGHFLMELHFEYSKENNKEYLLQILSLEERIKRMFTNDTTTPIKLLKVSNEPSSYMKEVYDPCTEKPISTLKKDTIVTKEPIKPILDTVVKIQPTIKKVDTQIVIKPPVIEKQAGERKNVVVKTITITSPTLVISMYDNAVVDGDTISVLHNGKLVVAKQLLNEKGIDITIELSKEKPHHEIVLFAHNLGSIPPNTALLVIKAGNERYELKASASLTENATLIFEYKPKE